MKKIITIRENLIREIDESGINLMHTCKILEIDYFSVLDYLEFSNCEHVLNGAEIQRIFDYLNGLK